MILSTKLALSAVAGIGTYFLARKGLNVLVDKLIQEAKDSIDANYQLNLAENNVLPFMWAAHCRISIIAQTIKIGFAEARIRRELNQHIDTIVANHSVKAA